MIAKTGLHIDTVTRYCCGQDCIQALRHDLPDHHRHARQCLSESGQLLPHLIGGPIEPLLHL